MEKIRKNRYYRLAATVIRLLLLVFIVHTVAGFVQTVSTPALLMTGGVILSWRVWKFMFRLVWLLLQIAIFFGVLYLLII